MEDHTPKEVAREFVLEAMRRSGLTASALARRAGKSPSTLNRFLNQTDVNWTLSTPTLAAIADVVGMPPPFGDRQPVERVPGRSVGVRDLPIRGRVNREGTGIVDLNQVIGGHTHRPEGLLGIAEAFAIYCPNDEMAPKYERSQLLHINPARPPRRGDYVLVTFIDDLSVIRRLVEFGDNLVELRMFSPARVDAVARSQIKSMYRVHGADELE